MVVGTGVDVRRLAVASRLGADIVFDGQRQDPVQKVAEITGGGAGSGLDFVFEASGNPQSIPQGLAMVRDGGKVVLIGIHPTTAEFSPTELVRRRKSLVGAYAYETETWHRSLALLASGRVQVEPLITHRLPLVRAQEGFELAVRKQAAKVIFIP